MIADDASAENTARDAVIDGMKAFVPPHEKGHIEVKFGAGAIQLERGKDETVTSTEVSKIKRAPSVPSELARSTQREPIPDVDEDGAFALELECAKSNRPVIDSPFLLSDANGAKFDED